MSYAIIRNEKYKMSNLPSMSRHNERKNKEYGNKEIDTTKSHLNYHLRAPVENSYEREFERLRVENNLKGNLRLSGKKQSNVACEFLITSDDAFFNSIGSERTRQFFKDAYEYACNKCGEKNILSAVVHMDEKTPHMHLTYIPVVKGLKKGQTVNKINCSEFWKGFNSYGILQDQFYEYCLNKGYNLDRGERKEDPREHLTVNQLKAKSLEDKIDNLENTLADGIEKHKSTVVKLKEAQDKVNEQFKIVKDTSNSLAELSERTKSIIGRLDSINAQKSKIPLVKGLIISEEDYSVLRSLAKMGESKVLENFQLKAKVGELEKKLDAAVNRKTIEQELNGIKLKRLQGIEEKYRVSSRKLDRLEKAISNSEPEVIDKIRESYQKVIKAEKQMSRSFDLER